MSGGLGRGRATLKTMSWSRPPMRSVRRKHITHDTGPTYRRNQPGPEWQVLQGDGGLQVQWPGCRMKTHDDRNYYQRHEANKPKSDCSIAACVCTSALHTTSQSVAAYRLF